MVKAQKNKVLGRTPVNVASKFLKPMLFIPSTEKIRTNTKDCCCSAAEELLAEDLHSNSYNFFSVSLHQKLCASIKQDAVSNHSVIV